MRVWKTRQEDEQFRFRIVSDYKLEKATIQKNIKREEQEEKLRWKKIEGKTMNY